MRVIRLGLATVKGTRHLPRTAVRLATDGPVGDRLFCLVDPGTRRVLKTVQHPRLLAVAVTWRDETLTAELGGGGVSGRPEPTGLRWRADYWGRAVEVEVLAGPWSDWFSAHLGRPAVLARALPGGVVYGDQVSLVSTQALRVLAPGAGDGFELAPRFRATCVLDAGEPTHAAGPELGWVGRRLVLGAAVVEVTAPIVRCRVVDLDPVTGEPDLDLLRRLPRDRDGRPVLGVQARVVRPGVVRAGDAADLAAPVR